jgi:hypothetical protein
MSTIDPKPVRSKNNLNPKLLPFASLVLVLLALLFMATPLLRSTASFQGKSNFVVQGNGQSVIQNGTTVQGSGSSVPNRPVVRLGGGAVSGATGAILYFVLLLIALVAAVGMLFTKRWGQVLGIIIAVLYGLLGLVSLLPVLLGIRNPLSLILGLVHLLLAVAVIVLASIPAKNGPIPARPVTTHSANI